MGHPAGGYYCCHCLSDGGDCVVNAGGVGCQLARIKRLSLRQVCVSGSSGPAKCQ